VSLEELGEQENLDAAVDLLTLPVRSEQELGERCRRILASRGIWSRWFSLSCLNDFHS
jgi:hypothetical protein